MSQVRESGRLLDLLEIVAEERGQLVHRHTVPARHSRFGQPREPLPVPLVHRLRELGVEQLYTHQAQAIDLVREGKNVTVVTGTASGKSLCYNVPVLESVLSDAQTRALYLFPTKALAQDQLKVLKRLRGEDELLPRRRARMRRSDAPDEAAGVLAGPGPDLEFRAGTYDGDTPTTLRNRLRDEANLLLTNPDMLHAGILPNHARWSDFFSELRYVIVDEIHVYRGIFGSHVANVLRRLRRIARHYGAQPQWICASATIANPGGLARALAGVEFETVDDDGSPRGRKHFVFWNPPEIGSSGMERRSSNLEARDLFLRLIREGYQAIAFVKARLLTEVLLRYLQEELREDGGGLAKRVRAYRAGYLPEERRKIEAALFSGELLGVVSTSALELGIDVGSLDAALMVGYPGTIASTWQQAGRAGRRQKESVAVLIGHNAPIDQYLMRHPDYFFANNPESAILDPSNPHILLNHLRCAIYEIPVKIAEEPEYGAYAPAILDLMEEKTLVRRIKDRWFYSRDDYPSASFSLRNSGENVYTIIDATNKNQVIGTIDESSAFSQVHPQAIYMHEAETYFVDELNLSERAAYIHKADVDYYTQAITDTHIEAHDPDLEQMWRTTSTFFGECSIHEKTCMFKKIKFGSRDSLGYGPVELPHITLHTTGLWLIPSLEIIQKVLRYGRIPADGLTGIANVLSEVVSLHTMCDPHDLGTAVDMKNTAGPTLFVYDKYPGGLGYAQRAFHIMEIVMEDALCLIQECRCEDGCPSCVGSPLLPHSQQDPDAAIKGRIPDKEAALALLHAMLGREDYIPKTPLSGERARRAEAMIKTLQAKERATEANDPDIFGDGDGLPEGGTTEHPGAGRSGHGEQRSGGRGDGRSRAPRGTEREATPVPREVKPLPSDLRRKLVGQIDRLADSEKPRRRSYPS